MKQTVGRVEVRNEGDFPLVAEAISKAVVRRNYSAATIARARDVLRGAAAGLLMFPGTKNLAALRMRGIVTEFMRAQMHATLHDYAAGERSIGSMRWWWHKALRECSESIFKLGKEAAGDERPITWLQRRNLAKTLVRERRYMREFLDDIENREGTMDYHRRLDLYVDGTGELFARGILAGVARTKRKGLRWHVGPTEHCKDCAEFDDKVFTPRQFTRMADAGKVPQGHGLECRGFKCQCYVVPEG